MFLPVSSHSWPAVRSVLVSINNIPRVMPVVPSAAAPGCAAASHFQLIHKRTLRSNHSLSLHARPVSQDKVSAWACMSTVPAFWSQSRAALLLACQTHSAARSTTRKTSGWRCDLIFYNWISRVSCCRAATRHKSPWQCQRTEPKDMCFQPCTTNLAPTTTRNGPCVRRISSTNAVNSSLDTVLGSQSQQANHTHTHTHHQQRKKCQPSLASTQKPKHTYAPWSVGNAAPRAIGSKPDIPPNHVSKRPTPCRRHVFERFIM